MASPVLTRIIAGCYEEMIVCYDLIRCEDEEDEGVELNSGKIDDDTEVNSKDNARKLRLKLSFTDHPHSGSVRSIAASKGEALIRYLYLAEH